MINLLITFNVFANIFSVTVHLVNFFDEFCLQDFIKELLFKSSIHFHLDPMNFDSTSFMDLHIPSSYRLNLKHF